MREKIRKTENLIFSILLMFLFIDLAVILTLNCRQLYYLDIDYLDISEGSGLNEEVIRRNYDVLIDYNSMFSHEELEFPDFPMSEGGRIHFREVKRIFVGLQYLLIADFILCAVLLIRHVRRKSFDFLKLTGIMTITVPLVLGILIALNWGWVFVTFHHLAFDNDYWLFDPSTDPVIGILPDIFFMHCAVMILVLTVLCAVLCLAAGHRLTVFVSPLFCEKSIKNNKNF